MAQWLTNPTRNHEVAVRSLALLSGLRIRHCHELWCRSQTQLGSRVAVALFRPVATAPIQPLAWEPPHATGAALEKAKKKKKERKKVPSVAVIPLLNPRLEQVAVVPVNLVARADAEFGQERFCAGAGGDSSLIIILVSILFFFF